MVVFVSIFQVKRLYQRPWILLEISKFKPDVWKNRPFLKCSNYSERCLNFYQLVLHHQILSVNEHMTRVFLSSVSIKSLLGSNVWKCFSRPLSHFYVIFAVCINATQLTIRVESLLTWARPNGLRQFTLKSLAFQNFFRPTNHKSRPRGCLVEILKSNFATRKLCLESISSFLVASILLQ